MDAGHQEQKGQYGQLHQASMGLDRLALCFCCYHTHANVHFQFSIINYSGCALFTHLTVLGEYLSSDVTTH